MPERIQMSRQKPWRADHPDAVIVARPSKWGNPFVMGATITRDESVLMFRSMVTEENTYWLDKAVSDLAGRDLACWCPLDQPCHADVLLELANPEGTQPDREAQLVEAIDVLAHIVSQATVNPVFHTDDSGEYIGRYDMPVGSIHKAIPFLARFGVIVDRYGHVHKSETVGGTKE
jgi:hypothetical protein